MPLQKLLCQHKNQIYWCGTKCFWLAQNIYKFLVWHKHFGPAHNSLGPVEGWGIRFCATFRSIFNFEYFKTGGVGQCGNKDFPNIYARLEDEEILNWIKVNAGIKTPGTAIIDIPNVFTTEAISSKFEIWELVH